MCESISRFSRKNSCREGKLNSSCPYKEPSYLDELISPDISPPYRPILNISQIDYIPSIPLFRCLRLQRNRNIHRPQSAKLHDQPQSQPIEGGCNWTPHQRNRNIDRPQSARLHGQSPLHPGQTAFRRSQSSVSIRHIGHRPADWSSTGQNGHRSRNVT